MCFSATVSYSAGVALIGSGVYAIQQARPLASRYLLLALIPLFFGIQQLFEGRVWQLLNAGDIPAAVPFAIGFHFFSHFLWLWMIPLCSYLIEPKLRLKRLFLGITLFGATAGGVVYGALLLHTGWMKISVRGHSIVYDIASTYHGFFSIGLPPSALYGLIILTPLFLSSQRFLRYFGALVFLSVVIASLMYGYAFVSVWCFFAAILSGYLAYVIGYLRNHSKETMLSDSSI